MTDIALEMLAIGFILHIIGEDIRDVRVKKIGTALGFTCFFILLIKWVGMFG